MDGPKTVESTRGSCLIFSWREGISTLSILIFPSSSLRRSALPWHSVLPLGKLLIRESDPEKIPHQWGLCQMRSVRSKRSNRKRANGSRNRSKNRSRRTRRRHRHCQSRQHKKNKHSCKMRIAEILSFDEWADKVLSLVEKSPQSCSTVSIFYCFEKSVGRAVPIHSPLTFILYFYTVSEVHKEQIQPD